MLLSGRRPKRSEKAAVRTSRIAALGLAMVAPILPMSLWMDPGQLAPQASAGTVPQALALVVVRPAIPVERRNLVVVPPPPVVKPCSTVLAGTQPHVAQVGNSLKAMFGIADIGGAIGRGGGDHGRGLALDFMVKSNALGAKLADFVLANQERFAVTYVIWQQRYNDGHGWSMMEDRGSPTANHMDHVHVSFRPGAHVDVSC